ncbi:MAG: hypothetical protein ABR987_24825 [Terracidiphilus sp.]|jgi:hypothetical protein
MKKSLLATAYHEAGHALADFLLGFKIKSVSIVADETSAGRVSSVLGLNPSILEYGNPSSKTIARWHDKALTMLAGEAAQSHFNPRSVRAHHAGRDRDAILDILERIHGDGDELQAVYRYLKIRARNLVCGPHRWFMVEAVVLELAKNKTLTGSEVEAVFRQARRPRL